jgi:hypothetical protein
MYWASVVTRKANALLELPKGSLSSVFRGIVGNSKVIQLSIVRINTGKSASHQEIDLLPIWHKGVR